MIGNVNVPGASAADLANKVDKVSGKGLSSNDFTDTYKLQLDNMIGSNSPYEYMTVDQYRQIIPIPNKLYWVSNSKGNYGIYCNDTFIQGDNIAAKIYGVEWDGTSTTSWTRTDDAIDFEDPIPYVEGASTYSSPFDNIYPWKDMTIVERYAGTMVKIPKFYYKLTQNENSLKIQISEYKLDGYHLSPAHIIRGYGDKEYENIYLARYKTNENGKSMTNQNVWRGKLTNAPTLSNNNVYVCDWNTYFTIWLLYLVEFANWDSQSMIGKGGRTGSSTVSTGYTDDMPYHTGTMLSSRDEYSATTQYRNIEGLWNNVYEYISGLCIYDNKLTFSNTPTCVTTGKTSLPFVSGGIPTKFNILYPENTFPFFYPSETRNDILSDKMYTTDHFYLYTASQLTAIRIGGTGPYEYIGLFNISQVVIDQNYGTPTDTGARMIELPGGY